MIYYFHWVDIFTNQIRRVKRVDVPELNREITFELADVAPTENVRLLILDDNENHLGVILFKR